MGWLSDFVQNPLQTGWDTMTAIPGSPEAAMEGVYQGLNGDLSWNPYSADNSVWDYGAGGSELSQDPKNRQIGRTIGTAVGSYFTGGALSGALGSTTAGGAASGALWGGAQAAGSGGNFLEGAAKGGALGGLGGYMQGSNGLNAAQEFGINDPNYQRLFNNFASNTVTGLAKGNNLGDSLGNAAKGTAMSGLNNWFSNTWKNNFGDGSNMFKGEYSDNPAQNASYGAGYSPVGTLPEVSQQSYAPPSSAAYSPGLNFSSQPNMQIQSAGSGEGAPSSNAMGFSLSPQMQAIGGWGANHAGDLASLLYGVYNNRKQQRMINQQRDGLNSLFSANSPYAQQMTNKLNAQAAARGTRSNVGGRQVQLAAALADRQASLAPQMYQLNQGQFGLQNNLMNLGLQGMNKLGGWSALRDMFGTPEKNIYQQYYGTQG